MSEEWKEIRIQKDFKIENIRYEISNLCNVRKILIKKNGEITAINLIPRICNKSKIKKFKIRFKNHVQYMSLNTLMKVSFDNKIYNKR